ncbi:hypothetical protein O181_031331 [Austropuccinia psidii MF-1]|uniref:Uncharacterized protein n=1 Tax=Austropuccinia psidii MF-1 TaxID=1389203 RepID=A0A9Q3D096_9BASI|nr:hypothetical protein [Austropuccinia psidii MF-1]
MNKANISDSESDVMDMDNVETSDEEESENVKGFLSDQLKNNIQTRIQDVIVPKGVTHITSQVGSARNGKLKESKWRALFSVYLLLVFLDSFLEGNSSQRLLTNTALLIKCTAIVVAKSITKEDAICFSQSYQSYQNTSKKLLTNIQITPNHHYAMHIPEQLMQWGPLMGLSEFSGERLVGTLQNLKTNSINGAQEEKIMKQFGEMQRLHQVASKYEKKVTKKKTSNFNKKELDNETYMKLFKFIKKRKINLHDYHKLPYPNEGLVFQNYAFEIKVLDWRLGLKVSKKSPNNLIYIQQVFGEMRFGMVAHILDLGCDEIHLLIRWLDNIKDYEMEFERLDLSLDSFNIKHLKFSNNLSFISSSDIVGLAAYRSLPAWALGCKDITMLVFPINKLFEKEFVF